MGPCPAEQIAHTRISHLFQWGNRDAKSSVKRNQYGGVPRVCKTAVFDPSPGLQRWLIVFPHCFRVRNRGGLCGIRPWAPTSTFLATLKSTCFLQGSFWSQQSSNAPWFHRPACCPCPCPSHRLFRSCCVGDARARVSVPLVRMPHSWPMDTYMFSSCLPFRLACPRAPESMSTRPARARCARHTSVISARKSP